MCLLTPQWVTLREIAKRWSAANEKDLGPEWTVEEPLQRVIDQYWIERIERADAGLDPVGLEEWAAQYIGERLEGCG